MCINTLTKIYVNWGDKNNLHPLGSADAELICNSKINSEQKDWLKKFIRVWDKANNRKDKNENTKN